MDTLNHMWVWIFNNETLLSALAAVMAITGVMSSWCVRLVQSSSLVQHLPITGFTHRIEELPRSEPKQEIRFTSAPDGSSIAYAKSGAAEGVPIVRSLGWFTHLEAEWAYSQGRALWGRLGRDHPLYRYDGRGIGLSSRKSGRAATDSLEDLEAVMDAEGIEQAILFGLSEGGLTAVEYAVKHPERVSHLILYGAFMSIHDLTPIAIERWATLLPLFKKGWGSPEPVCRQLFTSILLPDGDRAQNHYFNEMQRASCDGEEALGYILSSASRDGRECAKEVTVPTLIFHREGDLCIPIEAGRRAAEVIPGARMRTLPGNNHWMLAHESDSEDVVREVEEFVSSSAH